MQAVRHNLSIKKSYVLIVASFLIVIYICPTSHSYGNAIWIFFDSLLFFTFSDYLNPPVLRIKTEVHLFMAINPRYSLHFPLEKASLFFDRLYDSHSLAILISFLIQNYGGPVFFTKNNKRLFFTNCVST